MTRTVLWARHGENGANVSHTLSHRLLDPDLTERGRAQAQDLADRLVGRQASGGEPVGAIVCSPLLRARQTAAVVAGRLGLPAATVLEDLRELDVGSLDGRRDEGAWARYDGVLAAWAAGDPTARFPGGEDAIELADRLRRALLAAAGTSSGPQAALVVAHGGNIRAALPGLTGAPMPAADLPLGGLAAFGVEPGGEVRLREWGTAP